MSYFDPPTQQDDGIKLPSRDGQMTETQVEVMARSRDEALVVAVDNARDEFRREAERRGVTVEFQGFVAKFSDGVVMDMDFQDMRPS